MSARPRVELIVAAHQARMRLDRFLSTHDELGTRSQIQRLIRAGHVRVGDRVVKAGALLRAGDRVVVEPPAVEPAPGLAQPEAIPLDVLHEDATLLVINKPPGLVVHPAPGHWGGTLVNALLHHWGGVAPGDAEMERLGIVHRLDKDTSGVLVVAKTVAAHEHLARQFRTREIRKQYVALAWGRIARARGVIRAPIARHRVHRQRMAVREHGREAVTRYEVVERFAAVTYVRLHPETGRTHQLRVHLAALGHPIVADAAYGGRRRTTLPMLRQALHAEAITFRHPHTDAVLCVRAPLPPDFLAALAALRHPPLTSTTPLSSVERQVQPTKRDLTRISN